jgi:hypothetical protein
MFYVFYYKKILRYFFNFLKIMDFLIVARPLFFSKGMVHCSHVPFYFKMSSFRDIFHISNVANFFFLDTFKGTFAKFP